MGQHPCMVLGCYGTTPLWGLRMAWNNTPVGSRDVMGQHSAGSMNVMGQHMCGVQACHGTAPVCGPRMSWDSTCVGPRMSWDSTCVGSRDVMGQHH